MTKQQLIFVYNAERDVFSWLTEFAHKILSPSTYPCQLCALTHTNFFMKQQWRLFIEALPVQTFFHHKDEFQNLYRIDEAFPAVFIIEEASVKLLINKEEIRNCESLVQLKQLVSSKLSGVLSPPSPPVKT